MQGFGLLLLVLAGCGIIENTQNKVDDIKDAIEGLTNPLIAQGLILGVEQPDDPTLSQMLDQSDFESGTAVSLFLADAASASAAENAPVSGATVKVLGSDTVNAQEDSPGLYAVLPTADSLPYAADDTWQIRVNIEGMETSSIEVLLPPTAELNIPVEHAPQTALVLDFTGQDFDSAFIIVIDQTGAVTFTNEPTDIGDVLAITQNAEPITTVEVPGSAFPTEGFYAVGVAGMLHSEGVDVENANTLLSTLMAGKMRFYPTTALPSLP